MKTLNSVHSHGMAATIGGIGVLVIAALLLLSFVTLFSSAAGTTVTVQTSASSYPAPAAGGEQIPVSGTVSPAPGISGYAVSIQFTNTAGLYFVATAPVDASTGAFSYTLTTGPANQNWINGTYTVRAVYGTIPGGPQYTATTTFTYGAVSTTTTTPTTSTNTTSAVVTTIVNATTITQVTTVQQGGTTIVTTVQQGGTTIVTTVQQGTSTTIEALAIVGIVIAIIAGALAAMALRKK